MQFAFILLFVAMSDHAAGFSGARPPLRSKHVRGDEEEVIRRHQRRGHKARSYASSTRTLTSLGKDTTCHLDPEDMSNDGKGTAQLHKSTSKVSCQNRCLKYDMCQGIEYQSGQQRCVIWTQSIGATIKKKGYECQSIVVDMSEVPPEERFYLNMGGGECSAGDGGRYDQWSGNNIDISNCASLCTEIPPCLGFEWQTQNHMCILRFSDGTLPAQNPRPGTLLQSWDGNPGIGEIMQVQKIGGDRTCFKKDVEAVENELRKKLVTTPQPQHNTPPAPTKIWKSFGPGSLCRFNQTSKNTAIVEFHEHTQMEDCKRLCEQNVRCRGIEYRSIVKRCELWRQPIVAYTKSPGSSECLMLTYKRVALPAPPQVQVPVAVSIPVPAPVQALDYLPAPAPVQNPGSAPAQVGIVPARVPTPAQLPLSQATAGPGDGQLQRQTQEYADVAPDQTPNFLPVPAPSHTPDVAPTLADEGLSPEPINYPPAPIVAPANQAPREEIDDSNIPSPATAPANLPLSEEPDYDTMGLVPMPTAEPARATMPPQKEPDYSTMNLVPMPATAPAPAPAPASLPVPSQSRGQSLPSPTPAPQPYKRPATGPGVGTGERHRHRPPPPANLIPPDQSYYSTMKLVPMPVPAPATASSPGPSQILRPNPAPQTYTRPGIERKASTREQQQYRPLPSENTLPEENDYSAMNRVPMPAPFPATASLPVPSKSFRPLLPSPTPAPQPYKRPATGPKVGTGERHRHRPPPPANMVPPDDTYYSAMSLGQVPSPAPVPFPVPAQSLGPRTLPPDE